MAIRISKHEGQILSIIIFIALFVSQSCGKFPSTTPSLTIPIVTDTVILTATNTPRPTQTLIPTSTPTIKPTLVSPGIFVLLFYPPFIMNYDPSIWEDKSNYTDWGIVPIPPTVIIIENYLQARTLATCKIEIQGPTEFNEPYPYEIVRLGDIGYTLTTFEDSPPGFETARYIANESPTGDYPTVVISASNSEWNECRTLGEEVLSTLHIP